MIIYKAQPISPQLLVNLAQQDRNQFGEKFIKFSGLVSMKFDRIMRIGFRSKRLDL